MSYLSGFLSFLSEIRKAVVPDLPHTHRRAAAQKHNMCLKLSDISSICCVSLLPRDRLLTTIKGGFAYYLAVVHFRKR